MVVMTVERLYDQHIKVLSVQERLQLVAIITQELVTQTSSEETSRERSLLELEGLGAEIWAGTDAQQYVNKLRKEWDQRP